MPSCNRDIDSEGKYLLVVCEKGKYFHPLKEKFTQELGGCYTGIGYAFPQEQAIALKNILKDLPGARLVELPLSAGQSFEAFRQSCTTDRRRKQRYETDSELAELSHKFSMDLTEESLNSSDLPEEQKELIREKLERRSTLDDQIQWSEGMEKTLEKVQQEETKRAPVQFISTIGENWLSEKPPKKEMILFYDEGRDSIGFLPRAIVGMIAGPGGVGKSHLMAQIGVSVASGSHLFEQYYPKKAGGVFLGMGENSMDDLRRLIWKSVQHLSPEEKNKVINNLAPYSFHGQNAAFIENSKRSSYYLWLKEELARTTPKDGWDLLILDPASRLLGVNAEKDNPEATLFISLLEGLTEDLSGNPTVLFSHHVNKGALQQKDQQNQSAARGASALTDGCRWQLNFFKSEGENTDTYKLSLVKTNFTAPIEVIEVNKNYDGLLCVVNKARVK